MEEKVRTSLLYNDTVHQLHVFSCKKNAIWVEQLAKMDISCSVYTSSTDSFKTHLSGSAGDREVHQHALLSHPTGNSLRPDKTQSKLWAEPNSWWSFVSAQQWNHGRSAHLEQTYSIDKVYEKRAHSRIMFSIRHWCDCDDVAVCEIQFYTPTRIQRVCLLVLLLRYDGDKIVLVKHNIPCNHGEF